MGWIIAMYCKWSKFIPESTLTLRALLISRQNVYLKNTVASYSRIKMYQQTVVMYYYYYTSSQGKGYYVLCLALLLVMKGYSYSEILESHSGYLLEAKARDSLFTALALDAHPWMWSKISAGFGNCIDFVYSAFTCCPDVQTLSGPPWKNISQRGYFFFPFYK